MTPAARVAAAIDVLDDILNGHSAEAALSRWARNSRFAGSKDRAAVRDHVFDALRRKASSMAISGGTSGRDWMRGYLFQTGADLASIFGNGGHAPAPLTPEEMVFEQDLDPSIAHDIPEWMWSRWCDDLGENAIQAAKTLWQSADVFLRVNLAKSNRDDAISKLADDGIEAIAHPTVATALRVSGRGGKIAQSTAFQKGYVDLQDASSQASVMVLPQNSRGSVLDYCAGAGGKSLALAAWLNADVDAFDVDPRRMKDIPSRADRAGVNIQVINEVSAIKNCYDIVFCDAPCSGSGTWRRDPQGKWALTQSRLDELVSIQRGILEDVRVRVAKGGSLIYATCSVFACENRDQVEWFCKTFPEWSVNEMTQFVPTEHGDGFFFARLTQKND